MTELAARLLAWLRSLFPRKRDDGGWVEPANAVTRAILAPDELFPLEAPPAREEPIAVALPAETLAMLESVAAEEEAAAQSLEAARAAALPGGPVVEPSRAA